MSISFNGFNESLLTLNAASGFTSAGVPVKLSANGTVNACDEDDSFIGVSKSVSNGLACVQMTGAVTIGYSGTAPAAGFNMLAADGDGNVCVAATGGREYLVVDVIAASSLVTIIL